MYNRRQGGGRKLDALPSVILGAVGSLLRNVVHQPTITPAMYECSLSSQARPEISRACLGSPKVVPHPTQHGRRRCILDRRNGRLAKPEGRR